MSILAFLVARHCDLSCFIVFYYYSCAQVANKLIDWLVRIRRCLLDDTEPGQCGAVCELSGGHGRNMSTRRRWSRRTTHVLPRSSECNLLQSQPVLIHVQPQSRQHPLSDRPWPRRRHPGHVDWVQRLPKHGGSTRPSWVGLARCQTPWQ